MSSTHITYYITDEIPINQVKTYEINPPTYFYIVSLKNIPDAQSAKITLIIYSGDEQEVYAIDNTNNYAVLPLYLLSDIDTRKLKLIIENLSGDVLPINIKLAVG